MCGLAEQSWRTAMEDMSVSGISYYLYSLSFEIDTAYQKSAPAKM